MNRLARQYGWLCWVLVFALLVVRVADAHVHLCQDGEEAPVSVHAIDAGVHHVAPDGHQNHEDQDEPVADDGLLKKADIDFVAILPVAQALLVLLGEPWLHMQPLFESSPIESVVDLRPPPRGPPA